MDLFFHIFIPLSLLLLLGIRNKVVFYLLPFAIVLDFAKPFYPRETHSFIIIAAILLFLFLLMKFFKFQHKKLVLGISAFYLLSHILLDFGWHMPLFWPIIRDYYLVTFNVSLHGLLPQLNFGISTVQSFPAKTGDSQILAIESIGSIVLILGTVLSLKFLKKSASDE